MTCDPYREHLGNAARGNDETAMGAYEALKELGLRIPGDVAVAGFDNQEIIAAQLRPPLSTVALPRYEMGR